MKHPTAQQLRTIDLFDELDDAGVERFAQAAELRELPPGEMVAEQGKSPSFHLLLAGSLDLVAADPAGHVELIAQQLAPTWIGAIVVVTGGVSGVSMRTATDVTLAEIPPEEFIELVLAHRPVFDRVMRQVRPVVGRIARARAEPGAPRLTRDDGRRPRARAEQPGLSGEASGRRSGRRA